MIDKRWAGHLAAAFTIGIWGTTFISTKVLLAELSPLAILFLRFVLGLLVLLAVSPRRLAGTTHRQELLLAAAGFCGVCLYYLLENIALTYTLAANVGVIIAVAPFFTALLSCLLLHEERPRPGFFLGFCVALLGLYLISSNGVRLHLNPLGDLLALLAALVWAVYSVLIRLIGGWGFPTVLTTRRIFGYGLFFMLPVLAVTGDWPDLLKLSQPVCLFNILFLGVGASALCFVSWNYAVRLLGALQTSVYIYMGPVITLIASALILHERLTGPMLLGTLLVLSGLLLSELKIPGRNIKKNIRK